MLVVGTDLQLTVWETSNGETVREVMMSGQVSVPLATVGRGDAGYLAVSTDGNRVFVAWEDMLWALSGESLQVLGELRLPAPVDGMAQSMYGRELYLLPAASGDLTTRELGFFTVDVTPLDLLRHTSNWPRLMSRFFYAVPAPAEER